MPLCRPVAEAPLPRFVVMSFVGAKAKASCGGALLQRGHPLCMRGKFGFYMI